MENNIKHVDSLDIMNKKAIQNNENINEYFRIDRHNNKKQALSKAVKKQKDFLNHRLGG